MIRRKKNPHQTPEPHHKAAGGSVGSRVERQLSSTRIHHLTPRTRPPPCHVQHHPQLFAFLPPLVYPPPSLPASRLRCGGVIFFASFTFYSLFVFLRQQSKATTSSTPANHTKLLLGWQRQAVAVQDAVSERPAVTPQGRVRCFIFVSHATLPFFLRRRTEHGPAVLRGSP